MRKVMLTIVLIIVAVAFYYSFKALTYEPKEEQEKNDNEEKETEIRENDSKTYEEFYDSFLKEANANKVLLQSEDHFTMNFIHEIYSALATIESNDYELDIRKHTIKFNENREPNKEEVFEQYYEKIEDFDLGDIEGIIAKHILFEEYVFMSIEEIDGVLLEIAIKDVEDVDEVKETISQVELNRDIPAVTTERIAELTDINLEEVLALNLENDLINLINMQLHKSIYSTDFTLVYALDGGHSYDLELKIEQLNEEELEFSGKEIELENGRTVYHEDTFSANYVFQDGNYLYSVVFMDEPTEEKELEILNEINVKMLD